MKKLAILSGIICLAQVTNTQAQLATGWRAHDLNRPLPQVVTPGETMTNQPPSDAVILFDGTDLSEWADKEGAEAKWKIVDGAMESVPGSGYVFTKQKFGDCQLHVEWASPAKVKGKSQGRGNSGVFLMGKYEVQVLDSFDNPTYADGSAGSVYGQYPPLVNASRGPGQWQSYDIIFRRPKFNEDEELVEPARITVLHNGVLIQENSKVFGPTNWVQHKNYQSGPERLPLSLQDHGNPVRYRNIWIRNVELDRNRPEQPYESEGEVVEIDDEAKAAVTGKFGSYRVENRDGQLFFIFHQQPLEMIPLSKTKFAFRKSAGFVEFITSEFGDIESMELNLDATGKRKAKKVNTDKNDE